MAADISASAMFRAIEIFRPTLLIDEGDISLKGNEPLRGVINSGHGRDGMTWRVEGDQPKQFSTWTPVAVALIGNAADTIEDRAVTIRMRRRRRDEHVERLRLDRPEMFTPLQSRCKRWAIDNMKALCEADPDVPDLLNDRAADNWRPLLAIADAAGSAWPDLARNAAAMLSMDEDDDDSTARTMLLTDIRHIFRAQNIDSLDEEWRGRIKSGELCDKLAALEGRPWVDWHTLRHVDQGVIGANAAVYPRPSAQRPVPMPSSSTNGGDHAEVPCAPSSCTMRAPGGNGGSGPGNSPDPEPLIRLGRDTGNVCGPTDPTRPIASPTYGPQQSPFRPYPVPPPSRPPTAGYRFRYSLRDLN